MRLRIALPDDGLIFAMLQVTQSQFEQTIARFDRRETLRAQLYHRALTLIEAGFEIEAHLLILATWNFACFRYAMLSFNLAEFEKTLDGISRKIDPLEEKHLMETNLVEHRAMVIDVFDKLKAIRGVQSTGASKVLHLLNPEMFVMWDKYIRGKADDGAGYFQFLLDCQQRFQGLRPNGKNRTMAKCIDEYNYITKTIPAMEEQRITKEAARAKRISVPQTERGSKKKVLSSL